MSSLSIDNVRDSSVFDSMFGSTARLYATLVDAQIGQTRRVLEFYHTWLTIWGVHHTPDEYHSSVVDSAIKEPGAQARAWAMRYTSGGLAPAE